MQNGGAPSSPSPKPSCMSAMCEGLRALDAELQKELQQSQAGFDQLLRQVQAMQHLAEAGGENGEMDIDVDEKVPDIRATSVGISTSNPEAPQLPEGQKCVKIQNTDSERRQSLPVVTSTKSVAAKRRVAMRDAGRLKLLTCWTALQTLHEETHQAGNANKDPKAKKTNRRSSRTSRLSRLMGQGQDQSDQQSGNGRKTMLNNLRKSIRTSLTIGQRFQEANSELSLADHGTFNFEPPPYMKAWLPQSNGRLLWNFMGLLLLFYDIIVIPVEMAWDLEKNKGGTRYHMFRVALAYWTMDVMTNFHTGFFKEGKVILSHRKIAQHYIRTWFLPDFALIALDYALLVTSSGFALRSSRFIRGARLVRLIKQSKTSSLIDSMAVASGCTAEAVIILPLLKTVVFIFVGVHLMSCGWFWMGRSSMEAGDDNWLMSSGTDDLSPGGQYVHSFRWVLCQFTPAPNQVNPQNIPESIYTICTILVSMVTMGASLARISGAVQQLNAMKFAKDRRLREIRLYLLDQNVSSELSNRILTFADYSLQHSDTKDGIKMDYSLVSVKLRQELIMHRAGGTLCMHPLMNLIFKAFPDVFMRVCESISERVYEEGEVVFKLGSSAQCMYVVTNGDFLVQTQMPTGEAQETKVGARHWFTDVALFSNVVHAETLQSKKFGKVSMLEGLKFASLLQGSPACADVVIDYANRYLQALRGETNLTSEILREKAQDACENTQAFRWYSGRLRLSTADYVQFDRDDDSDDEDTQVGPSFLRCVVDGEIALEEAVFRLPEIFPELEPDERHVYTRFGGDVERFRAGASVSSVLCLLTNRYDLFTAVQDGDNRLSMEQWEEFQLFIRWADLSPETLHGLLVYLVIRGAGKIKSLVDQLPLEPTDSPETAIRYIMEEIPNLLPSCENLKTVSHETLVFLLDVQREFNIAQFMQGENSAFSVASLEEYVQDRPAHYYPAYLLSFVGIMSGIAGGEHWARDVGSFFMTQKNATPIVEVLRALKQLNSQSPAEVYWGYIEARSQRLQVPAPLTKGDPEYRVLSRLLCLYRAQNADGRRLVEAALQSLDESDTRTVVSHLTNDGFVGSPSYVLAFLPACLANANANSAVGLPRCLAKLAEIYGMLDARRCLEVAGGGNVKVDLSDFSRYIATVRSATVFNQCVEHIKIMGTDEALSLSMSTKNWSRVHDDDASEFSAYQSLRQLLNQQAIMKEILTQLADKVEAQTEQTNMSQQVLLSGRNREKHEPVEI